MSIFREVNESKEIKTMPKARTNEIVIKMLDDEVLIYDLKTHKAYNLNKTTSIVWNKCDGVTKIEKVVKILEKELSMELDTEFVLLAIKKLAESKLLEDAFSINDFPQITRRDAIKRYAISAISLPLIMSLTATEAQAASCLGAGELNCHITPCCPGNTCVVVANPDGTISNVCVAVP